jgi:LysM repeat protein|tara:strand:- start:8716 stop:11427 length:2712 start_codon:yes stop_codon:yes gene_type:complete
MTSSFQSTAGESFRTPVNTFVQPVTATRKSGMADLAEMLAIVNPTLQNFIQIKGNENRQRDIEEGQLKVLGASPKELIEIRKEVEAKADKKTFRQFLGTNRFMQYGIEKQLAINIANGQEAKTKKFFDEYVVNVDLPNGTTIQQPLSQFDVNSEAFDNAITEFQNTQLANTRGIRASLIREHILPKQNLALQKVFNDQETKLAESKIKQASILFNDSVLNSWFSIDNYNDNIELNLIDDNYTEKDRIKNNGLSQGEFLALEELQDNVDSMVNRGLATAVSPSKMIGQVKTNVLKILDYYESNNLDMDIAYEEVEEYINWIGNLKVGPKTILKNGNVIQQPLSSFYIADGEDKIETLLTDIYDKKEDIKKKQNDYNMINDQNTISDTLNNVDFSRTQFKDGKEALNYFKNIGNTLDALAEKYPEQIEFLYKQYDLRNFSVDDFFFELETEYDAGTVTQSQALIQLTDVMQALGPNASKADREKYTQLKKYLSKTEGKTLEQRFPAMKELIKYGQRTIGKVNLASGVVSYKDADDVDKMQDLNTELKKLVKENGGLDAQIDKDGKTTTVRNWYLGNLRKIKNSKRFGNYEFYDPALDLSQEFVEVVEDDDGQDDGKTVNIQEQKVLTYDTNTKLFSEVNTNELQVGPTTTVVSINGSVTPAGESLRQNLKIKSFENFNVDFYNATFEDNQTETRNEKLLSDDLEASAFSGDSPTTVEVEQGDTLSQLAEEFNVPLKAFMEANNITNADLIRVGDELIVPMVERINMKEVKNNQIKALDDILKDTDKTKVIPQPKIEEMLLAVGFEPDIAKIMAAVAMAESAGDPMIDTVKSGTDPKKENEFSIGLLQLNMKDDRDRLLNVFDIESEEELYDPIINVIAAKRLYDEQGLNAWSAYKNNSYKQFLKN